jgi:hypothetical protein
MNNSIRVESTYLRCEFIICSFCREVIGPSGGGILLEYYGFPVCSTVMACVTFVLVSLLFITTFSDMNSIASVNKKHNFMGEVCSKRNEHMYLGSGGIASPFTTSALDGGGCLKLSMITPPNRTSYSVASNCKC